MRLITNIVYLILTIGLLTGCSLKHFRSTNYSYIKPQKLNDGLEVDDLQHAGFNTTRLVKLTKLILADSILNIHSLLIIKDGKLIYENYFSGSDQHWGISLGYASHDQSTLHDTRSISKSIVAACIDIAIQQGLIKSIDDSIFDYLPGYIKFRTPQNEKITIRDFLTMSSGMKWNENAVHGTLANNETQMEKCMNPVEYVLRQPILASPGTVWNYNSGGVQVLAEIIKNVSGDEIDVFAQKHLFGPLGITKYKWSKTNIARFLKPGNILKLIGKHRDFPAAASGLELTSRDMAKFGLLYLNNGKVGEKQIISPNWINESFQTQILRDSSSKTDGYSYLFWTQDEKVGHRLYLLIAAKGNGGQRIFLCKAERLEVVITAGNYDKLESLYAGENMMENYILPAIQ
jgi:CubicO group peptidase (beta-lactamase class C family)